MRYFSKKEDYEKGFDDFLNKGTVDDDKTKAEFKYLNSAEKKKTSKMHRIS